jgi:ATP-binding cassette subfamily B protein
MIKTLIKSIRQYKKETILTPIFVTIEVILEVLIPLLMANLIDQGLYNNDMNVIYKIGTWLVLATLLSLLFGILA